MPGAVSSSRMLTTACFARRSSITLVGMAARAPRLRGRETETGVLREALDRVARGRQAIVLVEGEAGIGKTRLLEQALAGAAARGMQVAAGRADELEQARPFGLMTGAFGCVPGSADPRRAAIAGLLTAAGGRASGGPVTVTSDPGLQFRVVDAFGDLVEDLAVSGPVVVGADDLQWADPSSLVTLAAMGRRVADLPVGIIGCFRPASPRTGTGRRRPRPAGRWRPAPYSLAAGRRGRRRTGVRNGVCRAWPWSPGRDLGGGGKPPVRH